MSWLYQALIFEVRGPRVYQGATCACAVRSYKGRHSPGSDVCFLMAARTASWASSKNRIPPPQLVSRAISAPVVAIDRISPQKIPPMVSQITLEPPTVQPTVLEAMSTSLIGVSADAKPSTNDSFLRHDTYFFKDGNITFLVRVIVLYALDPLTIFVGRWFTLLCPSLLFLPRLGLLLRQVFPARRP